MLPLVAAALLAATPEAGSTWTWAFEDLRSVKVKGLPAGSQAEENPSLGKTTLALVVKEAGAEGPKRFQATVKRGLPTLSGRSWLVESNYGEAMLTESTHGRPSADVALLQSVLGSLMSPDPVVAVVEASPAPCDAATREQVAQASARLVARLLKTPTHDMTVTDAGATCVGKAAKYAVHFTTSFGVRDTEMAYRWKGTIEVSPGAWRSTVDVRGSSALEMSGGRRGPIHVEAKVGVSSRLSKAK